MAHSTVTVWKPGIWKHWDLKSGFQMVKKRLGCIWSGIWNQEAQPFEIQTNGCHFVKKTCLRSGQKSTDCEWSSFQMVGTKAIAIGKALLIEFQSSKSPDFKCIRISDSTVAKNFVSTIQMPDTSPIFKPWSEEPTIKPTIQMVTKLFVQPLRSRTELFICHLDHLMIGNVPAESCVALMPREAILFFC